MKTKVTVSVDEGLLSELDAMVVSKRFDSRSAAMEAAVEALRKAEADAQFERALDALTSEDVEFMRDLSEQGMADYAKQLEAFPW